MRLRAIFILASLPGLLGISNLGFADVDSFSQSKKLLRNNVYYDRNDDGDLYCGCEWRWVGASGGRTDADSCGYVFRKQETRAARIEWEHVLPASNLGRQRQCWQNGGRKNCTANDPVFKVMEANMHNLVPVVGELNADRSNYVMGEIPGEPRNYGQCDFEVDFKARMAEPPNQAKGMVARIHFYMADRYDVRLSKKQQQQLVAWDRLYPVSDWEHERDLRIKEYMGHSNPFVTGEAVYQVGHTNSRSGLFVSIENKPASIKENQSSNQGVKLPIHGNKNSKIYHLPAGCPSYNAMSSKNKVAFDSVQEAVSAGYRIAGNCR